MPYRCVITLKHYAFHKGELAQQASPLRFATAEEAIAFGRLMYEPPEGVESWEVEPVEGSANYSYKKEKLVHLQGG